MIASRRLPRWRSLLFVPANNERFLAKCADRGADALILDLEDSVPAVEKAAARARCSEAIQELRDASADLIVRINSPLRLAVPDLEAVVRPGLRAVMVPKCLSGEHLQLLSELVEELERERQITPGSIGFVPIIETPRAYLRMDRIAALEPRCLALTLGGEDFSNHLGMEPGADTLLLPKQQVVIAARASGVVPLGLLDSIANYGDTEHVREVARRSARFGFEGAACVHPALVPILNEAFTPSNEAIEWAQQVIEALTAAQAQGLGTARLNGTMIDEPIAARARRILQRAGSSG